MSLPNPSPRRRKSLSHSLAEHNLNLDNVTLPITNKEFRIQKQKGSADVGGDVQFQVGKAGEELSPRRKARRHAQPRKSILKPLPSQNDDSEETQQYAHTINFAASQTMISRRVSFAPNAHVRMFETTKSPDGTPAPGTTFSLPPPASGLGGPRSSLSSHSRRSSIQNIVSVAKPNVFAPSIFQGEGEVEEGEESMEIEEESDSGSEDNGAVEMGRQFNGQRGNFSFGGEGQQASSAIVEPVQSDEEEDMDMDITQNVYGGIVRRASMAANTTVDSDVTEEADISTRSDEEKTMDFTIAVGGLLPPQAPQGAMSNRNSIGYSFPVPEGSNAFRPGDDIEGEVEMEMEETVAFGGIIGPDDTISSGGDSFSNEGREKTMTFTFNHSIVPPQEEENDDDGMEMTMAQGGIISFPPPSPAPSTSYPPVSPGRTLSHPPVSPGRPLPTNTRPMSGTPSFARPTVSSAQKTSTTQKRNVFAPSPSPTKSTTPKKAGMQVAEEVAKRLSFGSATSSASKKRSRDDGEIAQESISGSTKKTKLDSQVEEVFGGTPKSQSAPRASLGVSRLSLGAPRASLGTPMRIARSPATARQSLVRVADPEPEEPQAEEEEEEEEKEVVGPEWEQPQTISLASFLEMAGVQFMEGLPGLNRRRSSVAKGILGQSYSGGEREFALHEYSEAQVNSIFLNMYTWAANKLGEDIRTGQAELDLCEARCDEDSPPVIQEYLSATDEDKQLFELTFKSFKTNTQLKAKEMWYDWKLQLMQTIKPDVEGMLQGMQEDNDRLNALAEQTDSILPDLKARQAALQAELEKEREIVAEIAACDQQELISLKEGITEQGTQINMFNSELEESTAKLTALTTKLEELNSTKRECVTAIQHAKSQCDQFTRSDAVRLQEEYTSIQHIHLWRPTKITSDRLELEFDDEISLSFACRDYIADLKSAQLGYLTDKAKLKKSGPIVRGTREQIPTEGLFEMLRIALREMVVEGGFDSLSSLVQRIGQLWSVSQRLRAELHYVNFRHPITYKVQPHSNTLVASVTMVLPSVRSKMIVDIGISQETIWGYPDTLVGTDIEIRKVYGKADIDLLTQAARQTISSTAPQGCLGAFLQVCVDVAGQYIK